MYYFYPIKNGECLSSIVEFLEVDVIRKITVMGFKERKKKRII